MTMFCKDCGVRLPTYDVAHVCPPIPQPPSAQQGQGEAVAWQIPRGAVDVLHYTPAYQGHAVSIVFDSQENANRFKCAVNEAMQIAQNCPSCGSSREGFFQYTVNCMDGFHRRASPTPASSAPGVDELLREAADELEYQDTSRLRSDPMGLRETPPRVARLISKLRAALQPSARGNEHAK